MNHCTDCGHGQDKHNAITRVCDASGCKCRSYQCVPKMTVAEDKLLKQTIDAGYPVGMAKKLVEHMKPTQYVTPDPSPQCFEVARHLSYNLGVALECLWPTPAKKKVADLETAVIHLQDEIDRLK